MNLWGAGMVQGESARLPPIRPGFDSGPVPYVNSVVRSRLSPRVFLRVVQFSSLHKNQHLQIPIWPG